MNLIFSSNIFEFNVIFLMMHTISLMFIYVYKTMKRSNKNFQNNNLTFRWMLRYAFNLFPTHFVALMAVWNLIVNDIVSIRNQFCIIFSSRPYPNRLSCFFYVCILFLYLPLHFYDAHFIMSFINTKYASDTIVWFYHSVSISASFNNLFICIFFSLSHFLIVLNVNKLLFLWEI